MTLSVKSDGDRVGAVFTEMNDGGQSMPRELNAGEQDGWSRDQDVSVERRRRGEWGMVRDERVERECGGFWVVEIVSLAGRKW